MPAITLTGVDNAVGGKMPAASTFTSALGVRFFFLRFEEPLLALAISDVVTSFFILCHHSLFKAFTLRPFGSICFGGWISYRTHTRLGQHPPNLCNWLDKWSSISSFLIFPNQPSTDVGRQCKEFIGMRRIRNITLFFDLRRQRYITCGSEEIRFVEKRLNLGILPFLIYIRIILFDHRHDDAL